MYPCPCCGYLVFDELPGSFDICPICYWEDDHVQLRFVRLSGGANQVSLMEAQRNYVTCGACEERFRQCVRPPEPEERRDEEWRLIDPALDHIVDLKSSREYRETSLADRASLYYWRDQRHRKHPPATRS